MPVPVMTPREVLIAAKALIDMPEKWASNSRELGIENKHCVITALIAVAKGSNAYVEAKRAMYRAMPQGFLYLDDLNDHPETTHADVMTWFDRAIEMLS